MAEEDLEASVEQQVSVCWWLVPSAQRCMTRAVVGYRKCSRPISYSMNANMSFDYRPPPNARYRAKWWDAQNNERLSRPTKWWLIARRAIPTTAKHAHVLMESFPGKGFFLHLIVADPKNIP